MYNTYEDYMQNVLGYSMPNTYIDTRNYYEQVSVNTNLQEINKLYPEIYGIVYPVIQKICSRRNFTNLTEEVLSELVEEVYNIIEVDEVEETSAPLKNGDVRNPRAKEVKEPRRTSLRNNQLLRDLIRILLLRELGPRKTTISPRLSRRTRLPTTTRPRLPRRTRNGPKTTNNETTEI